VLAREKDGLQAARKEIEAALADSSPYVRAIAAEALGRFGSEADRPKAVSVLMDIAPADKNGDYAAVLALNALNTLVGKTKLPLDQIAKLPATGNAPKRAQGYAARLIQTIGEGIPQ
jgi:uncharacterized sulfatase